MSDGYAAIADDRGKPNESVLSAGQQTLKVGWVAAV
jgi:hypothetical protein